MLSYIKSALKLIFCLSIWAGGLSSALYAEAVLPWPVKQADWLIKEFINVPKMRLCGRRFRSSLFHNMPSNTAPAVTRVRI